MESFWVKTRDGGLLDVGKAIRLYVNEWHPGHVTLEAEYPLLVEQGDDGEYPISLTVAHYATREAAEEDLAMIAAAVKPVKLAGNLVYRGEEDDEE